MSENRRPIPRSPFAIDYRLPHPALQRWVSHYYLLYRRDKSSANPIVQRIYPSDGTGLIFQLDGQVEVLSAGEQWVSHPQALAKGHFQKPFVARYHGSNRLLCVSFRPGMATHFLRDSQAAINDRFVPFASLFGSAGSELVEQLSQNSNLSRLGSMLDRFLVTRFPETRNIDDCFTHAVSRITELGGATPIGKIAEICGQTPRNLERRFSAALGMTPKYFCQTVRFRAFLRRLRLNPSENSAAAAQECGYFDQAHQIREFRRFTGTSPSQFWSQAEAIEAATTDIRTLSVSVPEVTQWSF